MSSLLRVLRSLKESSVLRDRGELPYHSWRTLSGYRIKQHMVFQLCFLKNTFSPTNHVIGNGYETHASMLLCWKRSFVVLFFRSFVCSCVGVFVRSFVRAPVGSFVRSSVGPFVSCVCVCVRSFVRSFLRSFARSYCNETSLAHKTIFS